MRTKIGAGWLAAVGLGGAISAQAADYAIALPRDAAADPAWRGVAAMLEQKYAGQTQVFVYTNDLSEILPGLRADRPRYLACVVPPARATRDLVLELNRLTRRLDDDPYGDCQWGIVTGPTAADARRVAAEKAPLVLERAWGTTGYDLSWFRDGLMLSDGPRGLVERRENGVTRKETLPETDEGLAGVARDWWDRKKPQFIVTSSHATQYNLEMPYSQGLIASYGGRFHVLRRDQLPGFARFLGGVLFHGREEDLARFIERSHAPMFSAQPDTPKVWIGAGNCLLGDARGSVNSMVMAALGAGGVRQLVGYTVPSWYGNMGWNTFYRFFNSRGRESVSSAFFFTNQELIAATLKKNPKLLDVEFNAPDVDTAMRDPSFGRALVEAVGGQENVDKDALGYVHDRDTVAFYGDPKWVAHLDPAVHPDSLQVECRAVADGMDIRLTAGEGYDGHGMDIWFPRTIARPEMQGTDGWDTLLTDDFLIVRKTGLKAGESCVLKVRSAPLRANASSVHGQGA